MNLAKAEALVQRAVARGDWRAIKRLADRLTAAGVEPSIVRTFSIRSEAALLQRGPRKSDEPWINKLRHQ